MRSRKAMFFDSLHEIASSSGHAPGSQVFQISDACKLEVVSGTATEYIRWVCTPYRLPAVDARLSTKLPARM